jgi:hypothetical protein
VVICVLGAVKFVPSNTSALPLVAALEPFRYNTPLAVPPLRVTVLEVVSVVNVPAAADDPPIVVPSIVPPLMSVVVRTEEASVTTPVLSAIDPAAVPSLAFRFVTSIVVVDRAAVDIHEVVHVDDVRAVDIEMCLAAVRNRDPGAARGLNRDALGSGRVVLDDVLFLNRRNNKLARAREADRRGDVQDQGSSGLRGVGVRVGQGQVGVRGVARVAVADDGLLQRSAQIGVGNRAPGAGVFTGRLQLDLQV